MPEPDTITCRCGVRLRVPDLTALFCFGRCTECGLIFDLARLPDGSLVWSERIPPDGTLPLVRVE